MILSIYKSRWFRYLACFYIAIILNGCTELRLIKDYGSPDIDISSVTKVYLTDGRVISFIDDTTGNQLMKIEKEALTYKNAAGDIFTVSTKEITRCYEEHDSPMNTILLIIGCIGLAFISLIIAIAISLGGHGFAG